MPRQAELQCRWEVGEALGHPAASFCLRQPSHSSRRFFPYAVKSPKPVLTTRLFATQAWDGGGMELCLGCKMWDEKCRTQPEPGR